MKAYLISDVKPKDREAFETYRNIAADSIAHYGGKYLVRGGEVETFEGTQRARTIVIVAFPSMEQARRWYRSPEYAHALKIRDQALERELILVDGIGE
jgi:uncharacterized protein (DUF1330 family)